MQRTMTLASWLLLCACAPQETASEGSSGDGTGTTDTPTTGAEVDPCDPQLPPVPEQEFAERFAAAICEQKDACGCAVDFGCALDFVDGFASIRQDGANIGLTYDGVCAARKLAGLVQARGCAMASAVDTAPACTLDCLVYRGAVPVAGACELPPRLLTAFLADTCAAPGTCSGTACDPPLPIVADGQPCVTPLARCEPGSACDYADSKTCEQQVGAGQSCVGASVCGPRFHCAGGTCVDRKASSEPCTIAEECASRRCTDGTCEDWVWICEVAEGVDIFARHPGDF